MDVRTTIRLRTKRVGLMNLQLRNALDAAFQEKGISSEEAKRLADLAAETVSQWTRDQQRAQQLRDHTTAAKREARPVPKPSQKKPPRGR
jgi:hypothetical protein